MSETALEDRFYEWIKTNIDWKDAPFRIAKLAYRAGYAQAEADAKEIK